MNDRETYKPQIIRAEEYSLYSKEKKTEIVLETINKITEVTPEVQEEFRNAANQDPDHAFTFIMESQNLFEKVLSNKDYNISLTILMKTEGWEIPPKATLITNEVDKLFFGAEVAVPNLIKYCKEYPEIFIPLFYKGNTVKYKNIAALIQNFTIPDKRMSSLLSGFTDSAFRKMLPEGEKRLIDLFKRKTSAELLGLFTLMFEDETLGEAYYNFMSKMIDEQDSFISSINAEDFYSEDYIRQENAKIEQKELWDKNKKDSYEAQKERDYQQKLKELQKRSQQKLSSDEKLMLELEELYNWWINKEKTLPGNYRKSMLERVNVLFNKSEEEIRVNGNAKIFKKQENGLNIDEITDMLQDHGALYEVLKRHGIINLQLYVNNGNALIELINNNKFNPEDDDQKAIIRTVYTANKVYTEKPEGNNVIKEYIKKIYTALEPYGIFEVKPYVQKSDRNPQKETNVVDQFIETESNRHERRLKKVQQKFIQREEARAQALKKKKITTNVPVEENKNTTTEELESNALKIFNIRERETLVCKMVKEYFEKNEIQKDWDKRFENARVKKVESAKDYEIDVREIKPNSTDFGDRVLVLMHKSRPIYAERIDHKILDNGRRISAKILEYKKFYMKYLEDLNKQ